MIAKKVAMRSIRKSDFGALVEYLTDRQGKHERIGNVWGTNCQSEGWQVAITEVLNTQAQNTRSTADKTYHVIVSFRADEQPGEATLKAIETRICEGLGYGSHQRICVVHHDTDNLHFHIAINKIHPTRYTIRDPYNDHWTLGILCTRLEQEYHLQADNHQVGKTGSQDRAADMERQAGVQSLLGWIQSECADRLKNARSWGELHTILGRNGLELREKGNGLVITNGAGIGVKASSVARELSKTRLERCLGTFQPADVTKIQHGRQYEARPVRLRVDTTKLFRRYSSELEIAVTACKTEGAAAAERKNRHIESARKIAQYKRDAVKIINCSKMSKKVLYGVINRTLKDEIQKIKRRCLAEGVAIKGKYKRPTWADWLRTKALKGDPEALAALRAREAATGLKGDTITGKGGRKHAPLTAELDCITKKGTIIYHVGSTAVRDDGDRLQVSRGANIEGLQGALLLASEHYDSCIAVNGTEAFKEQVARAAAIGRLSITFDDAALERRRQELLGSGVLREKASGHDKQPGARTAGRRTGVDGGYDSRGTGGHGCAAAAIHPRGTTGGTAAEGGAARYDKPYVGGVGREPPPQSQNRLRELSELGVVHLAGGGQVLLPRDVPDRLERQGAKPDHRVRRGVPGPGEMTAGQAAAVKYVAEREAMRLKASGVPKHRLYDHEGGISAAFAGIRKVEGELLALLKRGDEILVLPVGAGTAQRLKRVPIGDTVTVTANGSVTRARGRKI